MLRVRNGALLVKSKGQADDEVAIEDFSFTPSVLKIDQGTEVTWNNIDPTEHTVTAENGSFDSEPLPDGSKFSTMFDKPGEFGYFCQIHPTMKGTIRVLN
jgi:plastocyanin